MKDRVQYKKEAKIEICYQGNENSTRNLQLAQGTIRSDNVNLMGMLSPSKGI